MIEALYKQAKFVPELTATDLFDQEVPKMSLVWLAWIVLDQVSQGSPTGFWRSAHRPVSSSFGVWISYKQVFIHKAWGLAQLMGETWQLDASQVLHK